MSSRLAFSPEPIDEVSNPPPFFDGLLSSESSLHYDDGFLERGAWYHLEGQLLQVLNILVRHDYHHEDVVWGLIAVRFKESKQQMSYVLNPHFLDHLKGPFFSPDSGFC